MRAMSAKRRRRAREQAKVRELVFKRDGHRCVLAEMAGTSGIPECFGHLTPHHIVKSSAGGEDSLENEVTTCSFHNDWLEDEPDLGRELGLVARRRLPEVPTFPRTAP